MNTKLDDRHFLDNYVQLRVSLIYPEVVFVQICVIIAALARALDYLIPPNPDIDVLSVVESAMPLPVWGGLMLLGGLLALLGLHWERFPWAFLGHTLLAAVYLAFTAGAFIEVMSRDTIEGWRTPIEWLLVFTAVHWGFANASIDEWRRKRGLRDDVHGSAFS